MYIWTVLAAVIILAVGYVLYDANAGGHADKYGSVQRYVHFDDDWGTQRGMVWRLALDDYKMNLHGMKRFLVMDRKRLVL